MEGKNREVPPQSSLRDDSSPKGTPFGNAVKLSATAKSRPLGEGGKAEGFDGRGNTPQPCISPHKGVYWGKKEAFAMWFVYALGSAVFAALTSILAKIGIEGVNSTLATAIRTAVVLLMSWGMVFLTGTQTGIADISRRSWLFLVLSGLATGASWLCYYHALQVGAASKVVPIDKLSVVITLALAFVVLHEPFTAKSLIGCALITAGTLFMVL